MKFFYVFLVFVLSFAVAQAQNSYRIYKATSAIVEEREMELANFPIYIALFSCQTNDGDAAHCIAWIIDYKGEPLLWHKYAEHVNIGIIPSPGYKQNEEGKTVAFFGTWHWEMDNREGENFVIVEFYQNTKGHPYICFKMLNDEASIIVKIDAVFAGLGFFPKE